MKLPRRSIAAAAIALLLCFGALGANASADKGEAAPAKSKVTIVGFAFKSGRTVVASGGKVTFRNTTEYTHTATNGKVFDTGHIPPGQSVTVRFKQPGVYGFHCELHPFMTGKIIVK